MREKFCFPMWLNGNRNRRLLVIDDLYSAPEADAAKARRVIAAR
jgi:hypothetical protein